MAKHKKHKRRDTRRKRWYCGRKLSAALAECIKQTANDSDEIKTMQAYAAHVDHTEQRIAKLLKEGGFE